MTEQKQRMCDFLIKNFGFEDERFDDFMTTYAYYKVLEKKGDF